MHTGSCSLKVFILDIPHFKEVVIMATVCEYCGHKTNEVKSGGGIEPKGKRIILNVTDGSDLSRDVLKVKKPKVLALGHHISQSSKMLIIFFISCCVDFHIYIREMMMAPRLPKVLLVFPH